MKDILQSIQNEILSSKIPLADILLRAKVLAHMLKNTDFKNWVSYELDGYPNQKAVPAYRILTVESVGTFANIAWKYSNSPIPLNIVPDSLADAASHIWLERGVKFLEEMSKQDTVYFTWPGNWVALFNACNESELDGFVLHDAHRPIPGSILQQVVHTARSRLLDFILELDNLEWNTESTLPPHEVGQLVALTIYNQPGATMSTFDQRGQNVQYQYNAGNDINIGAVQNQNDFIEEMEKLKAEVSTAGRASVLNEENVIDAEYEMSKAILEAKKPEPEKRKITEHLSKAKKLVEGTVATAGLAKALMELVELAKELF